MSRTLVRPAPDVARSGAGVLFLAIAALHFVALPAGFHLEAYVGVSLVLACVMGLIGAFGFLVENSNRIWWFALIEGVLNMGGWFATRWGGLPATEPDVSGDWFEQSGLLLFFCGTALAALAAWVLRIRQVDRNEPISSARDRLHR